MRWSIRQRDCKARVIEREAGQSLAWPPVHMTRENIGRAQGFNLLRVRVRNLGPALGFLTQSTRIEPGFGQSRIYFRCLPNLAQRFRFRGI